MSKSLIAIAVLIAALAGCSKESPEVAPPQARQPQPATGPTQTPAEIARALLKGIGGESNPSVRPPQQLPSQPQPTASGKTTPVPQVAATLQGNAYGEEKAINLPAPAESVCVGGAGRYLVLHLPALRKLAVFDLQEGSLTGYISIEDNDVAFVAGASNILVFERNLAQIVQYDLRTRERGSSVALPAARSFETAVMGCASDGPALIRSQGNYYICDPATLKCAMLNTRGTYLSAVTKMQLRANTAGNLFFGFMDRRRPCEVFSLTIEGNDVNVRQESGDLIYAAPTARGNQIFTGAGIFSSELSLLEPWDVNLPGPLPALDGDWYFVAPMRTTPPAAMRYPQPRGPQPIGVDERLPLRIGVGRDQPLASFPYPFSEPISVEQGTRVALPPDMRIWFSPATRWLVALARGGDKLLLRRIDLDKVLDQTDASYLFFESVPAARALIGQKYVYQVKAKAKRSPVTLCLDSGPPQMKLDAAGNLQWPVDSGTAGRADVIVSAHDAAGHVAFQTFSIDVVDPAAPKVFPAQAPNQFAQQPSGKPRLALVGPRPVNGPKPNSTVNPNDLANNPPFGAQPIPGGPAANNGAPIADQPPAVVPPGSTPATLKTTVQLPEAIGDVVAGGAGKYLVFSVPRLHKLGVLDVEAGKVAHYISIDEERLLFAAGKDSIVVVQPRIRSVTRYSIISGDKHNSVPLAINTVISQIVMGAGSNGPLYVQSSKGIQFCNAQTLKPIEMSIPTQSRPFVQYGELQVRASTDGQTFAAWMPGVSPTGFHSWRVVGNELQGRYEHTSAGNIIPAATGRTLYAGNGLYSPNAELLKRIDGPPGETYVLPAVQGELYMLLTPLTNTPGRYNGQPSKALVGICLPEDSRPAVVLAGVDVDMVDPFHRDSLPLEKRLFLLPNQKRLVAIPKGGMQFKLYDFDLDESLKRSDTDYLLVNSTPPSSVAAGGTLQYEVQVKSKRGGVVFKLVSGPPSMKISEQGLLSWHAPLDDAGGSHDVIISISDASNHELFHSFHLDILGPHGEPVQHKETHSPAVVSNPSPAIGGGPPPVASSGRFDPSPTVRTWFDEAGKFTTNATFIGAYQDQVTLRKNTGELITVPLSKLSVTDKEYVRQENP